MNDSERDAALRQLAEDWQTLDSHAAEDVDWRVVAEARVGVLLDVLPSNEAWVGGGCAVDGSMHYHGGGDTCACDKEPNVTSTSFPPLRSVDD